MDCNKPGFPVYHQLPEFTQTHVHWVGDVIQLSHPLSSPSPPAFSLFQHQSLFQWVSSLHQVAKVLEFQLQHQSFQWIFSFNISPSNEYSGLIFFRMDWLDLLEVQGTLKSLLQHQSSIQRLITQINIHRLITPGKSKTHKSVRKISIFFLCLKHDVGRYS